MAKKRKIKNIINWLKDAVLKSLVILLVVAAGYYAYAQITWPADNPNPVSGVVGMFVGESDGVFDASVNSYDDANALCSNHTDVNIAGSHVCTPAEMTNSYNHGTVGVSPIYLYNTSATLWVNSGPPGYTANANDCKGWTKTDSPADNPNFGTVWNFDGKYGGLLHCRDDKKFACCK